MASQPSQGWCCFISRRATAHLASILTRTRDFSLFLNKAEFHLSISLFSACPLCLIVSPRNHLFLGRECSQDTTDRSQGSLCNRPHLIDKQTYQCFAFNYSPLPLLPLPLTCLSPSRLPCGLGSQVLRRPQDGAEPAPTRWPLGSDSLVQPGTRIYTVLACDLRQMAWLSEPLSSSGDGVMMTRW